MNKIYNEVISYIVKAGQRIKSKSGKISDIGITKEYLTKEDIRIEKGLKRIIKNFDKSHELFAEEENSKFKQGENVWVADPISCTNSFIYGLPHYGIVVSHLMKGKLAFSAVYDPAMDELYTAYRNKGSFLNDKKIKVSSNTIDKRVFIIFNLSKDWPNHKTARQLFGELAKYKEVYRLNNSFAVNYGYVAAGKYDGVICLTKDSFPEYAGSLLIREAGGIFTNHKGEIEFDAKDRIFVGGNKRIYPELRKIVDKVFINKSRIVHG